MTGSNRGRSLWWAVSVITWAGLAVVTFVQMWKVASPAHLPYLAATCYFGDQAVDALGRWLHSVQKGW